jgi:L-alanine-DL-glutamate epimerase-like enolase superfamily enzyme
VIVRVELEGGSVGHGEAAPFPAYNGETQPDALRALASAAPRLAGSDARNWRAISGAWNAPDPPTGSALCALETAVLDAVARHDGVPLWSFFGGAATTIETDMTVTTGTVREAAGAAAAIVARGIRVIKVKVGGPGGPEADAGRIAAVAEAAPGSPLVIDGNAALSRSASSLLVAGLRSRQIAPALLEQWLPKDDLDGMRALSAESGWRVAADESVSTRADARRVARAGAAQVINVKLMKAGVAEALGVVAEARAAGIGLMIGGNVESILAMTMSACFACGLGGFEHADLDTPLFLAENPFLGGYALSGGTVSVSGVTEGHGVVPRGLLL